MLPDDGRRLKVLTWRVHGTYLYYLSQVPHDFHLVTRPGHPPGHAGRVGRLPWGANVHEVPYEQVAAGRYDCVLYQHRRHWDEDRLHALGPAQRALPTLFLEHDPPLASPTGTQHPAAGSAAHLVHVTPYNALMWDNGGSAVSVIEHGVPVPLGLRYDGGMREGIVVVNGLARRGRRLGADVFESVRHRVPLTLVGVDSESLGGIGEVPHAALAARMVRHRYCFNPVRYTSLGLAVIEAMSLGLPVVGLATTEMPTVIRSGVNGYVDNRIDRLVEVMRMLGDDRDLARAWGSAARHTALSRFSIERFVEDWDRLLRQVAGPAR